MKMLIIEPCIVNYGDDHGGVAESAGAQIDVPKDIAASLVTAGRALYVKRDDDPSKAGVNTASAEMLKAAKSESAKTGG